MQTPHDANIPIRASSGANLVYKSTIFKVVPVKNFTTTYCVTFVMYIVHVALHDPRGRQLREEYRQNNVQHPDCVRTVILPAL